MAEEVAQQTVELSQKEEVAPSVESVEPKEEPDSEDNTCVDEECKCHKEEKEEEKDDTTTPTSSEEEEIATVEVVRIRRRHRQPPYTYLPPGMTGLAFFVLFLHLLNALLQLSERTCQPTQRCLPQLN